MFEEKKKKTADRPVNKHSSSADNLSRLNTDADMGPLKWMRKKTEYTHVRTHGLKGASKQNVLLNYVTTDSRCVLVR